MKNVASLKNKIESPKTPGGISKSLLTPCRRVGLSRNWRKGGPSPFVSPLAGSGESKQEKRKIDDDLSGTPTRNVSTPKRKKSKICLNAESPVTVSCEPEKTTIELISPTEVINENESVTPVLMSKSKSKKNVPPLQEEIGSNSSKVANNEEITSVLKSKSKFTIAQETAPDVTKPKSRKNSMKLEQNEKKSPENLTKECIVVIQNKIFKKGVSENDKNKKVEQKVTSQTLFDSDTDDVPLCQLNKNTNEVVENSLTEKNSNVIDNAPNMQQNVIQPRVLALDDGDDFIETKVKVHKLEHKTTSTSTLKKTVKKKLKDNKPKVIKEPTPSSQSSEDDDFDYNQKRTILVRKSYEKVQKPLKAKSTGSITQSDIDELRSRIEVKKKLLLAKAMTEDTEELRELIKKWQKGCQDALSELMDMMRKRFPDKQNMEFSELLQTLRIPTSLVGYDEENDCFITPNDTDIILGNFNDL